MTEAAYQAQLIKRIKGRFPDCIVTKNDSAHKQGIPDLTIFFNDMWAMLEVKAHANASIRPNQKYFVERLDTMSFAAFIYPENEEDVLDELQSTFESRRGPRISQS